MQQRPQAPEEEAPDVLIPQSLLSGSSRYEIQRGDRRRQMHMNRKLRETALALLYLAPVLILFTLFSYYPFFRAILLSFNFTDQVGDPVRFAGLRYYQRIFDPGGDYLHSLVTSFEFALMVVFLQIICGLGLAWLALANVRGIGIFRTIFTSSIAISLASAAVIWALIFNPSANVTTWLVNALHLPLPGLLLNVQTALPSMSVMTVWSGLGFNFVISLAGMQAIPLELYESASLDGAGRWALLRYITLPLMTPILLFLVVINTIQSFQAFTQFNVLMSGPGPDSTTNVFVYMIYQTFWFDHNYGLASAMSIVLFLILLVLGAGQIFFLGRRVHYR